MQSRGEVETIPDIHGGDRNDQSRERLLVIMTGGFLPHLVRHRVRAIADARDGLGECQRGALRFRVVRRIPPSRYDENPLVRLAFVLEVARMVIDADTT